MKTFLKEREGFETHKLLEDSIEKETDLEKISKIYKQFHSDISCSTKKDKTAVKTCLINKVIATSDHEIKPERCVVEIDDKGSVVVKAHRKNRPIFGVERIKIEHKEATWGPVSPGKKHVSLFESEPDIVYTSNPIPPRTNPHLESAEKAK